MNVNLWIQKWIKEIECEKMHIKFLNLNQKTLEEIDEILMKLISGMKINEWFISDCIEEEILKKIGYFGTMPQYLTVAYSYLRNEEHLFLKPAACFPIYPQIKQYGIKNEIITTLTNVFRYDTFDDKNHFWEFTVREIVLVGTTEYVIENMEKIMENTIQLLESKGIDAEYKVSTDHFYPCPQNRILGKYQKANKLKKELIVMVKNEEIVLGSFNYHGTFFSKKFGFDNNCEIVTGCIGLE